MTSDLIQKIQKENRDELRKKFGDYKLSYTMLHEIDSNGDEHIGSAMPKLESHEDTLIANTVKQTLEEVEKWAERQKKRNEVKDEDYVDQFNVCKKISYCEALEDLLSKLSKLK